MWNHSGFTFLGCQVPMVPAQIKTAPPLPLSLTEGKYPLLRVRCFSAPLLKIRSFCKRNPSVPALPYQLLLGFPWKRAEGPDLPKDPQNPAALDSRQLGRSPGFPDLCFSLCPSSRSLGVGTSPCRNFLSHHERLGGKSAKLIGN